MILFYIFCSNSFLLGVYNVITEFLTIDVVLNVQGFVAPGENRRALSLNMGYSVFVFEASQT